MPDNTQPTTVPDYTADIEQDAAKAAWDRDVAEELRIIREQSGLPEGAEGEIESHFANKARREMEANGGESESQNRWYRRREAPLAWEEKRAELIGEMQAKAARYQQAPQVPAGHPAHRSLSPLERGRMNDRAWAELKQDEAFYAELSPAERKKFDASFAVRRK